MRTPTSALTCLRPRTLADALRMMADEPLAPLAGGTDIYVGLQFGTLRERRFIDIWRLDELRAIEERGTTLRIGALVTYTALIDSSLVQRALPMLVSAAREVGGPQIQHRGTLGGNIANASPAGDTLPVLAAVDATVVLAGATGERRIPFNDFYTGYRTTARSPHELITAVEIPRLTGRQYWRKVGTRRAQAISKVMCAGVHGARPRLAFGSVGPTVLRARRTEAVLASGGSLADAQDALRSELTPIDDVRSTADYRLAVSLNLLAEFWQRRR